MFGSKRVKTIMKTIADNNDIEINANLIDVAMKASELRALLKTHCILTGSYINQLLKGHDTNLNFGKEGFIHTLNSQFYGKGMDPILYNAMERLLVQSTIKI